MLFRSWRCQTLIRKTSRDDESDEEPPTRLIIGPFMELPSKKLYADYYQFIAEPIAMDVIEKRIAGHQYTSLKDMQSDIALLAKNAKTYNEDGSMIYNDAVIIEVGLPILSHSFLKSKC